MRFVIFSDLHLEAPFLWDGPSLVDQRRRALRTVLSRIMTLADEVGADAVLCAGDLYEYTLASSNTGEILRSAFESIAPIPVFVSPGNHDWFGPESLYQQTQWSPNVHIFNDRSLRRITLEPGLTLWGGAHLAPHRSTGFLDAFHTEGTGIQIALFHGSEAQGMLPDGKGHSNAPFSAEQIPASGLHHAFVGHYHQHHDAEFFTYSGNPDPLTFSEARVSGSNERGPVIADVRHDGSIDRQRRRVAVTQIHELNVSVAASRTKVDAGEFVGEALEGLTGVARVTLDGMFARNVGIEWFKGIDHSLDGVHFRFSDPVSTIKEGASPTGAANTVRTMSGSIANAEPMKHTT